MPHLGNLVGSLLSGDVFSRYYKLKGFDTIYVSGSDSHGTRMEHIAKQKNITPKELVFANHKKLKVLLKAYNIAFDNYTITHNPVHHAFVSDFYKTIEKNGFLQKHEEEQLYCATDETFLADRFVEGTCPHCKTPGAKGNQCDACGRILNPEELLDARCVTCGNTTLALKKTTHWYLDLPKLEPKIKRYIAKHPEWKGNVRNFTERWLQEGLKERAITRDLKWGIPAPFEGAKNKVIYVWAEAVLGYVSAVKQLFKGNKKWLEFWQANNIKQIHTIGKDNIPFHSIILPALLLANKGAWHLPDQISSTEFLNWIGGAKFSKTTNTGIYMDEALDILPAEYWRFYLLYNRPEKRDVDFSWDELEKSINDVFIGNIGNLVNRTLTFTERYFKQRVPKATLNKQDNAVLKEIERVKARVEKLIEREGSLREALHEITRLGDVGNKYFQEREPWKNKALRANTVYVCLRVVKALSVFLNPFTPGVSERLWKTLNIKPNWDESTKPFADSHMIKKPKLLVQKIDKKEVIAAYERVKQKKKQGGKPMVAFSDFEKLELKIGTIKAVEDIKGSDKLFTLRVDTGEERTLVAGIKGAYEKKELIGRQIVVIANLEPRKLRGVESQGMLLAADSNGKPVLVMPQSIVKSGAPVH